MHKTGLRTSIKLMISSVRESPVETRRYGRNIVTVHDENVSTVFDLVADCSLTDDPLYLDVGGVLTLLGVASKES